MPRLRSLNETSPYSTRYVGRPALDEVLDQRAAAAQVEAERGRGQRRHQQHRVARLADLRRPAGSGRPRAACPSSIRVRGIGRRSARPPYSSMCATLLAAATTWSGFGTRSMCRRRYPERRSGRLRDGRRAGLEQTHEVDPRAGARRRGPRCGGGARPDAEAARHPAQLPGRRAPALPARAVRPRAAAVHRHRATTRSGRSAATSGAGSTPPRSSRTTTSASAPTTT